MIQSMAQYNPQEEVYYAIKFWVSENPEAFSYKMQHNDKHTKTKQLRLLKTKNRKHFRKTRMIFYI